MSYLENLSKRGVIMYIKFQYGLLYFSDYPAEGFKPVVLNQPPFLEDDEIAIYHWT